jgi:hypothetical protein
VIIHCPTVDLVASTKQEAYNSNGEKGATAVPVSGNGKLDFFAAQCRRGGQTREEVEGTCELLNQRQ